MQLAKNGNTYGVSDPDFIHFADEQSGVLLPSMYGYPDFLPQLQLTSGGRLCFWNFPAWIYKTDCNKSGTQGTSNWLRDAKNVSAANLYPPIPADRLGTNGPTNQYFWNSCQTAFTMDATLRALLVSMEAEREYIISETSPYSKTKGKPLSQFITDVSTDPYQFPPVGKPYILSPWQWITLNVQYYINRYLTVPYDVTGAGPYATPWIVQLNLASQSGDIQKWLSAINFLFEPSAKPDFFQSVANVLPTAILGLVAAVATIVTAGGATPALLGVLKQANAKVQQASIQSTQTAAMQQAQTSGAGVNTGQVSSDVSSITGFWSNATPGTKNIIYIVLLAVIILLIIYRKKL